MSTSTLKRPISVEQIAEAIKQMSQAEIQRLLDLVPKLRLFSAAKPRRSRTLEEAKASVETLWAEITADPNYRPLTGNEPFLAGLTLDEYLALPDKEQAKIWDEAAEIDIYDLEEREVRPDAILSAR